MAGVGSVTAQRCHTRAGTDTAAGYDEGRTAAARVAADAFRGRASVCRRLIAVRESTARTVQPFNF